MINCYQNTLVAIIIPLLVGLIAMLLTDQKLNFFSSSQLEKKTQNLTCC